MIIEYVRYSLNDHTPDQLIAAYAEGSKHLLAAPECSGFELAQCVEDERAFVLRIRWRSLQDHLSGFRGGPHFPPFLAIVRPFIGEIVEMRHYTAVNGGS